ncbi:hypothetical protein LEP1GSC051_2848 [Leptospira sp. P2653]|nr:hypothetical protein LEP1GSC051_2848 [Leptospira sp. P2653]EMN45545.1 hypothetical protein LEP1GSC086_2406 [Leptospira weilii str. LNT 1234]
MSTMEIKIVSLRNRFPIDLFIGRFFYFREKLKALPGASKCRNPLQF